jgi:ribosomal protein S18 acetylase RimI-like enzyme
VSVAGIEVITVPALEPALAETVGRVLAGMDPWATLGYSADTLARGLALPHPDLVRYVAIRDGATLGLATIRYPWLRGAYIELFAVLPPVQGGGVGDALLTHVEATYRGCTGNLWLLVSGFNTRARRFYERNGFGPIGPIPDLLLPGEEEVLMRKRL